MSCIYPEDRKHYDSQNLQTEKRNYKIRKTIDSIKPKTLKMLNSDM